MIINNIELILVPNSFKNNKQVYKRKRTSYWEYVVISKCIKCGRDVIQGASNLEDRDISSCIPYCQPTQEDILKYPNISSTGYFLTYEKIGNKPIYLRYNKNKKPERWILNYCEECGKIKWVIKGNENINNFEFCSYECYNKIYLKRTYPKQASILNNKDDDFYYLIGMIITDGSVNPYFKGVGAVCGINSTNFFMLDKLMQKYGKKCRLVDDVDKLSPTQRPSFDWEIASNEFVNYLMAELNLTQNKTYNLNIEKWFSTLTNKQKWHLLRGIIDGDGCLGLNLPEAAAFNAYISIGNINHNFLEMLGKFIGVGKRYDDSWDIQNKEEIIYVINNIYGNDFDINTHVYMDYKYFISRKILEGYNLFPTSKNDKEDIKNFILSVRQTVKGIKDNQINLYYKWKETIS